MKLHRRLGTTSLYVTHDQVEAMTLAHRMIVMYQGVPEQIGTPMEVFEKPASTFVAGFIGSPPMNLMEVNVAGDGTVQTADGQPLEISPLQVPSQVRGRKVIMGMRPEHMLLNTQGVPCEVEMVETLGSEQLVHCRVGKTTLVVRCTTRQLSESPAGRRPRQRRPGRPPSAALVRDRHRPPRPGSLIPRFAETGTGAACGACFIRRADPPALFHQYVYVTIVPTEY